MEISVAQIIAGAILLILLVISSIGAIKESKKEPFNPHSTQSRTEALKMEEKIK